MALVFCFKTASWNVPVTLYTYLVKQNPHYWAIQEKFQKPYQRKNIELVIHGLLQDDLKILAELKKTSEDILQKLAVMRNRIELRETFKTTFTLSEIRDNIQNQYLSLKKQYENPLIQKKGDDRASESVERFAQS